MGWYQLEEGILYLRGGILVTARPLNLIATVNNKLHSISLTRLLLELDYTQLNDLHEFD